MGSRGVGGGWGGEIRGRWGNWDLGGGREVSECG